MENQKILDASFCVRIKKPFCVSETLTDQMDSIEKIYLNSLFNELKSQILYALWKDLLRSHDSVKYKFSVIIEEVRDIDQYKVFQREKIEELNK